MADHSWALEDLSRAVYHERLAEAARDRLADQVPGGKPGPVRLAVASLLRNLASWLDDAPSAVGERRLARAQ